MKKIFAKSLLSFVALLTMCIASGAALFQKPNLVPDKHWHIEITTLKAYVRFFGHAPTGRTTWMRIAHLFSSGSRFINSIGTYLSDTAYNALQYFTIKMGIALYAGDALQIQDETWSGPAASYMITRAVIGADTLEKGTAMFMDGIRKKKTIPRIEVSNFMQQRQPDPVSQGQIVVDGRVLDPQDSMLYFEFDPRDFEQHFYAENLTDELLYRTVPDPANAFLVMQTMRRLNEFFENLIHRGRLQYNPNPGGADVNPTTKGELANAQQYYFMDGFIKKLLDAGQLAINPTILVPNPVPLTTSNIRDTMSAMINLLPQALIGKYGKGGVKFSMSYYDFLTYSEALRTDAFKNLNSFEKAPEEYRGYDIETLGGLPAGTMYLAVQKPDIDSNTWVGCNSLTGSMI